MQDQNDNMTETRGSLEERASLWGTFKGFVCPCFAAKPEDASNESRKKESDLKAT
jgi:hypothetical protein